jgi:hypothetical protein
LPVYLRQDTAFGPVGGGPAFRDPLTMRKSQVAMVAIRSTKPTWATRGASASVMTHPRHPTVKIAAPAAAAVAVRLATPVAVSWTLSFVRKIAYPRQNTISPAGTSANHSRASGQLLVLKTATR